MLVKKEQAKKIVAGCKLIKTSKRNASAKRPKIVSKAFLVDGNKNYLPKTKTSYNPKSPYLKVWGF